MSWAFIPGGSALLNAQQTYTQLSPGAGLHWGGSKERERLRPSKNCPKVCQVTPPNLQLYSAENGDRLPYSAENELPVLIQGGPSSLAVRRGDPKTLILIMMPFIIQWPLMSRVSLGESLRISV